MFEEQIETINDVARRIKDGLHCHDTGLDDDLALAENMRGLAIELKLAAEYIILNS